MKTTTSLFAFASLCLALGACTKKETAEVAAPEEPAAPTERAAADPAKIVFSMRGSEADFRKCFMRAIGSRGYVKTAFLLDADGRVEDSTVTASTIGAPQVSDCIKTELAEKRLGGGGSPERGEWTFVFRLTDPIPDDEFEKRLEKEQKKQPTDGVSIAPGSAGQLDPYDIEQHVAAKYPLFARCYRDSIKRLEAAGGILRLRFSITPTGQVENVEDAGSVMPDAYAVDCVAEGFYAMTFPAPSGGAADVLYRLDFE